jgi:hypothetical protein
LSNVTNVSAASSVEIRHKPIGKKRRLTSDVPNISNGSSHDVILYVQSTARVDDHLHIDRS